MLNDNYSILLKDSNYCKYHTKKHTSKIINTESYIKLQITVYIIKIITRFNMGIREKPFTVKTSITRITATDIFINP